MLFRKPVPTPEDNLQIAQTLLERGETVRAEELLLKGIEDARKRFGQNSAEYADAQNNLGMVLAYLDQNERAIHAFRAACFGPIPKGETAHKDRLTYLSNLAGVLEKTGKLDEAEQTLREGLAGRLAFYGREHAGYAFGLEPLATLLLKQGKLPEARSAIAETVANFWNNAHPRVAGALALQAEIALVSGDSKPLYAGLENLPDELVRELALAVQRRVSAISGLQARALLSATVAFVSQRLGEINQATCSLLSLAANVERDLGAQGDPQIRQAAARRVIAAYDRLGQAEDALVGTLGLALAQSDAGDLPASLTTYDEARRRAEALRNPVLLSQTLRNYGLCCAESGQREQAEALLRQAVQAAERGSDRAMHGRALTALGIFLQHGQDLSGARPILEHSLRLLEPADADAVCARMHLYALQHGQSCGCDEGATAIKEAFREFVLARLPQDLLEHFDVRLEDNDFAIEVHVRRELQEGEADQMNRVITHALHEFRQQLTRPS